MLPTAAVTTNEGNPVVTLKSILTLHRWTETVEESR
jgi:hypothetical protein